MIKRNKRRVHRVSILKVKLFLCYCKVVYSVTEDEAGVEGDNLIVGNTNKSGDYFTITKDGIYTFQKQYEASSTNGVWYNSAQETDVLVEQIPEYEGYLVTDGVDDQIRSSAITMGKDFTVVTESILIQPTENNVTGIVKPKHYCRFRFRLF